jgi:hypothetical protein
MSGGSRLGFTLAAGLLDAGRYGRWSLALEELLGGMAARTCVAWLLMVTIVPVLQGSRQTTWAAWMVLLALVPFFGGLFGLTEEGCLSPRLGC